MHTHNRRSQFDVRAELYRVLGVDLTQVPGLQSGSALVLFTELGPDFSTKFPTAKCFASWLGLCPDILGHVRSRSVIFPGLAAPEPRLSGLGPSSRSRFIVATRVAFHLSCL